MRRVAVIGVGMTKFGEQWDRSFRELVIEAGVKAVEDASLSGAELQAGYIGNMGAGSFIGQEHIGALLADFMGITPIPITRVENACASGGCAVREGFLAVSSGMYDIVVVGGVEKMTDLGTEAAGRILGGAGDQEWELFLGATFPALYALMARRHMHEFGTTEEQLASVAVKNHKHGAKNPYAQFQKEISIQDVLKSKIIAHPLKVFDCSPITDGAAAIILAPVELARKYTDKVIEIIGVGQATDAIGIGSRDTLTGLKATEIAAKKAYEMGGITPSDVDVAEVHDCFTIAEIMATEDLGFFKKGEGGKAVEEGQTSMGGKVVVNTSGGLKAAGHPVGATGVKQIAEIVWQLRGEANGRQVDGAEIGLTHNVGGSGATAVVHILKAVS